MLERAFTQPELLCHLGYNFRSRAWNIAADFCHVVTRQVLLYRWFRRFDPDLESARVDETVMAG